MVDSGPMPPMMPRVFIQLDPRCQGLAFICDCRESLDRTPDLLSLGGRGFAIL